MLQESLQEKGLGNGAVQMNTHIFYLDCSLLTCLVLSDFPVLLVSKVEILERNHTEC